MKGESAIDEKFLGLCKPIEVSAVGNYLPCVRTGSLLFLSGMLPRDGNGLTHKGKLGKLSKEEGYAAARNAVIYGLQAMRKEIGTLDRVRRILRLEVFVNAEPDFSEISYVANGASDLLLEIFGEAGKCARLALGVSALPMDASVEVSLIAELRE